jgi:hypothetical protein
VTCKTPAWGGRRTSWTGRQSDPRTPTQWLDRLRRDLDVPGRQSAVTEILGRQPLTTQSGPSRRQVHAKGPRMLVQRPGEAAARTAAMHPRRRQAPAGSAGRRLTGRSLVSGERPPPQLHSVSGRGPRRAGRSSGRMASRPAASQWTPAGEIDPAGARYEPLRWGCRRSEERRRWMVAP